MRAIISRRFCAAIAGIVVGVACQATQAGMITELSVLPISNNSGQSLTLSNQLRIIVAGEAITNWGTQVGTAYSGLTGTVAAPGANQVNFIFVNLPGMASLASSIADVYFDDGSLLGIATLSDSGAGVAFNTPATPSDLPGGNSIPSIAPTMGDPNGYVGPFTTTAGFSADSDSPIEANGVNPGEWLSVTFNLINGQTYANVLSAINLGLEDGGVTGALRIGMHVQAIGTSGQSDGFINGPVVTPNSVVPEPSSLVLLSLGGLGAAVVARRRKQQAV